MIPLYRYHCGCIGFMHDREAPYVDRALFRRDDCALDHRHEFDGQKPLDISEQIEMVYQIQEAVKNSRNLAILRRIIGGK